MVLDGRTPVSTGSTKVGSLIGDHTKTSIGTLMNTGAYVGAMALIATNGKLLPKFLPSFAWYRRGRGHQGFRQEKGLRDGQDGHEPPQVHLDRGRRGPVGRGVTR